jgi:5'-nucleotidase
VNVGVYNLLDQRPDLVVSGINAGFNMGIGFVLSSGTVGACLEANLAGIPAIALSQAFDTATRDEYVVDYLISEERMAVFDRQITAILDKAVGVLLSDAHRPEVLASPITWNINCPFALTDPHVVRYAPLGNARYGRCFEEEGSSGPTLRTFRHAASELVPDHNPSVDSSLLRGGSGTISAIDLWSLSGQRPRELVERVATALP